MLGKRSRKKVARIDFDVELPLASPLVFIVKPLTVRTRASEKIFDCRHYYYPLAFNHHTKSKLWIEQLKIVERKHEHLFKWATEQLTSLVKNFQQHQGKGLRAVELLRASGALSVLGFQLGSPSGSMGSSEVSYAKFSRFPKYNCFVELRRRSSEFTKTWTEIPRFPRTVLFCYEHDREFPGETVDIIELRELANHMRQVSDI